jgi:4-hydroxythreonine-4-phosphate dehydrogenase
MSTIAVTMGCPVGIGPEIIVRLCSRARRTNKPRLIVVGDLGVLQSVAALVHLMPPFVPWQPGTDLPTGGIAVYEVSRLDCGRLRWGQPDSMTGKASATYLEEAVQLIGRGMADAVTTCPISKYSWHQAGYDFPGHTEMLAALTDSRYYAMMLAGSRLRVVPATIHLPLRQVPEALTIASLLALLATIDRALRDDFAISTPRIGVAGLNPHSGEGGLFGDEETNIIAPAILQARQLGLIVEGPLPPDTIFHQAAQGAFDTVLAMYHDQGLIPFKLLHFADGVNVTLGLPIVRTSVDHGTAYDIAGKGVACDDSLAAAVELAGFICRNRGAARTR